MFSLHQLRCFLTVYELGSLTAAAEELGYAQPSISEQIRALEKSLGIAAVPPRRSWRRTHDRRRHPAPARRGHHRRRRGGATGGAAGQGLRDGHDPVRDVRQRPALRQRRDLVVDVLERYPGVRVEIIGQNSSEVLEDLRRGRIEAALIAAPPTSEGLQVTPVARDELVYVSAGPATYGEPGDRPPAGGSAARDGRHHATEPRTRMRLALRKMLHEAGHNPQTRIEVEDVETAIELMGRGLADTVVHEGRGPRAGAAPGPRGHVDSHCARGSTRPSPSCTGSTPPSRPPPELMIELAVRRIRQVAEPIG